MRVTGEVKPVDDMIRFVVAPDGAPVARSQAPAAGPRHLDHGDPRRRWPQAVARKAFARSFKRDVRVAPELVDATERLLERAALDALAIAHKAGRSRRVSPRSK